MPGIAYIWGGSSRRGPVRSFGYVSPRVQDVLGFSPDQWHASARIHPHDQAERGRGPRPKRADRVNRSCMEYRFLAKDGSVVWVLDHASLISRAETRRPGLVPRGDARHHRSQGCGVEGGSGRGPLPDARPNEARSSSTPSSSPTTTLRTILAQASPCQYVSPQAAELVRYPVERWLEEAAVWFEMVHPDDRERLVADHGHRIGGPGDPWSIAVPA